MFFKHMLFYHHGIRSIMYSNLTRYEKMGLLVKYAEFIRIRQCELTRRSDDNGRTRTCAARS